MPDGRYTFTDYIDDDGLDPDPIPIAVTITVDRRPHDRRLRGTARQVRGAINSPIPFTKSTVYACVRHLIGGDPPNNEGYFRPIEVRAPAGTVVNPVLPASVAARGLTGFRMANAVFGALAKIAPDRVFACESGGDTGISYGGYDADRQAVRLHRVPVRRRGAAGRTATASTLRSSVVNFSNNPIEIIEAEQPLRDRAQYGYVPDTGGAGSSAAAWRWSATTGSRRDEADASSCAPTGGGSCRTGWPAGGDGTPSTNMLDPDGARRGAADQGAG